MSVNIDFFSYGTLFGVFTLFGVAGALTLFGVGARDEEYNARNLGAVACKWIVPLIWICFCLAVVAGSTQFVFAPTDAQISSMNTTAIGTNQNDVFAWVNGVIFTLAWLVAGVAALYYQDLQNSPSSLPKTEYYNVGGPPDRLAKTNYEPNAYPPSGHPSTMNGGHPTAVISVVANLSLIAASANYVALLAGGYAGAAPPFFDWTVIEIYVLVSVIAVLVMRATVRSREFYEVYVINEKIFGYSGGTLIGFSLDAYLIAAFSLVSLDVMNQYYMGYGPSWSYAFFGVGLPFAITLMHGSLSYWWHPFVVCQSLYWTCALFFTLIGASPTTQPYFFAYGTFNRGYPWSNPPAQTLNANVYSFAWDDVKLTSYTLSSGALAALACHVAVESARSEGWIRRLVYPTYSTLKTTDDEDVSARSTGTSATSGSMRRRPRG